MGSLSVSLARLQALSASFLAGTISRDEGRAGFIDIVQERLNCSRVSLWRFEGEPGSLELLCFASKRAGGELDTTPSSLRQVEYRAYFDDLVATGMYVSHDALADPALMPMRDNYLVPNHVLSLLDAAFMVNGRAYGMVCCEQTDRRRDWRNTDVSDLRALVSKLALLMAGAGDAALWRSPSMPMAAMPRAETPPPEMCP